MSPLAHPARHRPLESEGRVVFEQQPVVAVLAPERRHALVGDGDELAVGHDLSGQVSRVVECLESSRGRLGRRRQPVCQPSTRYLRAPREPAVQAELFQRGEFVVRDR
jgi:hypothetical protein